MTKKLLWFGAAIMTTLFTLMVVWQFRVVVSYVLISLMLSAALRPLGNRLAGRRLIVRMAWMLLYLVALGSAGFLIFKIGMALGSEAQVLAQTVSVRDKWTLPVWLEGSTFQHVLIERLPPPSNLFEAATGEKGQLVLPAMLNVTQGIGDGVSGLLVIVFLSIYWSINQIHFERLWLSLLPSVQRKQARGVWRRVETDIGAYIRGEVIQSFLAGVFLFLGFWLLRSPYPVLLALIGSFASLVPVLGMALGIIPVLLLGMLTSVSLSIWTALYALAVLAALGFWIKPRLIQSRWNNPILTTMLLIAMASAFGLTGIILAPPTSVVCQILWSRLVSRRAVSGASEQISDLKERQARVWDAINGMDEPHLPLVASSMERLSSLIAKAEPVLQTALPDEPSKP